ncbi:hypothetical protein [Chloroflexus sp.]|uniref:hypothetical protein n=1 Tax=Chloroflexus sp. TaxID=1904827 RepID=UPI002ACEB0C6|nr:hypothetical protein [Chloroflexus sp.]
MNLSTCPTCKAVLPSSPSLAQLFPHVCPPAWEAREADDESAEWERIYATDAKAAARPWLEHRRQGSGVYEQGREAVLVRRAGDNGEGDRFEVWMRLAPSYTACRSF